MCVIGQVKISASEFHQGDENVKSKNLNEEAGGFVLWQKNPDQWCLELIINGSKVISGCNAATLHHFNSSTFIIFSDDIAATTTVAAPALPSSCFEPSRTPRRCRRTLFPFETIAAALPPSPPTPLPPIIHLPPSIQIAHPSRLKLQIELSIPSVNRRRDGGPSDFLTAISSSSRLCPNPRFFIVAPPWLWVFFVVAALTMKPILFALLLGLWVFFP
ncbi:hypothetical protein ACS0TY_029493 [Phlomoides rotata]